MKKKEKRQKCEKKTYTASCMKMKHDLTLIMFPVERLLAVKIGKKKFLEICCKR